MKVLLLACLFYLVPGFSVYGQEGVMEKPDPDSSQIYRAMVLNPKRPFDLSRAFNYYNERSKTNLIAGDTLAAMDDFRYIVIIQQKAGFYFDSEQTAVQALKMIEHATDSASVRKKISFYNHLGLQYTELKDYQTALHYFELVLKDCQETRLEAVVLNNIGNVYRNQGDYDQAIDYYRQARALDTLYDDNRHKARILSNMGVAMAKSGDPDGLKLMQRALKWRKALEYDQGVISSCFHLSEYYESEGSIDSATYYAEQAIALSRKMNNSYFLKSTLGLKVKLSEDPDLQDFKKIIDSIEASNRAQANAYAAKKYSLDREKSRADQLANERDQERSRKQMAQVIGLLLLIGAILSVGYVRQRNKKRTLQAVLQTENAISNTIHDEVANSVYHIMSQVQADQLEEAELINQLDSVYERTRSISRQYKELDEDGDFKDQLRHLLLTYQSPEVNVVTRFSGEIPWEKLSVEKKTALYRVIQELLINMKKHSGASLVLLTVQWTNKKLEVFYSDNGQGTELTQLGGLRNAENRILSLNGTITFDSKPGEGFKVKIIV